MKDRSNKNFWIGSPQDAFKKMKALRLRLKKKNVDLTRLKVQFHLSWAVPLTQKNTISSKFDSFINIKRTQEAIVSPCTQFSPRKCWISLWANSCGLCMFPPLNSVNCYRYTLTIHSFNILGLRRAIFSKKKKRSLVHWNYIAKISSKNQWKQ